MRPPIYADSGAVLREAQPPGMPPCIEVHAVGALLSKHDVEELWEALGDWLGKPATTAGSMLRQAPLDCLQLPDA